MRPWLCLAALMSLSAFSRGGAGLEPKELVERLAAGKAVFIKLEKSARNAQGGLDAESLSQALESQAPLLAMRPDGAWLSRDNPARLLVIENVSTVPRLSAGLAAWGWPVQVAGFEDVEKGPAAFLDAAAFDLVVFSSPGWWDGFANPPSGPSRLPPRVAEAAKAYLAAGGSALFLDIAQWDLLKIWPKSLRLAPLGPSQTENFGVGKGKSGALKLARAGVVADKVLVRPRALPYLKADFEFSDGATGPAYPAFAVPYEGGKGWVAGLAFHVFEQDESTHARRLLLNLMLASGASRVRLSDERTTAPAPSPVPSPTEVETLGAAPTLAPTEIPTAAATPSPRLEVPSPTKVPSSSPTRTPLPPLPSPVPPTPKPTPRPAAANTATPWPSPVPLLPPPTEAPASPIPSPLPTQDFMFAPPKGGLGCLQSSPEPFSEGGAYVFFCLRHPARIRLRVFDAGGNEIWASPLREVPAGKNQEFFNARTKGGGRLKSGAYFYRVEASYGDGQAEWRQSAFSAKMKRRN